MEKKKIIFFFLPSHLHHRTVVKSRIKIVDVNVISYDVNKPMVHLTYVQAYFRDILL